MNTTLVAGANVRDSLEHQLRKTERIAPELRLGVGGHTGHVWISFSLLVVK